MSFKKRCFFTVLSTLVLTVAGCGSDNPPAPTIESIEVKANSVQTEFAIGDTFNVDGGKLVVTWSNQSTEEVDMTLAMVTNAPNMSSEHLNYTVNVVYEEKETSYTINVKNVVTRIDYKNGSLVKTSYDVGDEFSLEGGQIYVSYSDGTRPPVDMTMEMIVNPPNMDVPTESYTVNVKYEEKQTSFKISILKRVQASISISYEYLYETKEIEDYTQELSFVVGENYKFYHGTDPEGANDSIYYGYWTKGDNPTKIEKPTEIGEYQYRVYIPEGDSQYKPVMKAVDYKIVEAVSKSVVLNEETEIPLTEEVGEAEVEVEGVTVKINNAKAASEGVATLLRDGGSRIEIDEVKFTSPLKVEFEGDNNFVWIYGSYNLTDWVLVDTLSAYKSTTDRVMKYPHARICSYIIGHDEMVIKNIEFEYEPNGLTNVLAGRAENSDLIANASSAEGNAYFVENKEVYLGDDKSLKSVGIRLRECSVNFQFGTTLKQEEIERYRIEFYVRPTDNATYLDGENPVDVVGIYAKPTNADKATMGKHLKIQDAIPSGNESNEWTKVSCSLVSFFENGLEGDISGINLWLNRACASGHVLFDDIRLVQKDSYPDEGKILKSIALSGEYKTEFNKGDEFDYTGLVVTAHYNDWEDKEIALDDENLIISEPNMNTSGPKTITISYTDTGKTRTATYQIEVVGGGKSEETLDIVDDSLDLANTTHQFRSTKSYDTGLLTDETVNTYGTSVNAIRATIPEAEKNQPDSYFCLKLDEDISGAEYVTLKFFAKDIGEYDLYIQLYSEDSTEKAKRDSTSTKGDITTKAGTDHSFTMTDAGNGWTLYSYTYYAGSMTKAISLVRVSTSKVMPSTHFFIMDGIEVFAVD